MEPCLWKGLKGGRDVRAFGIVALGFSFFSFCFFF